MQSSSESLVRQILLRSWMNSQDQYRITALQIQADFALYCASDSTGKKETGGEYLLPSFVGVEILRGFKVEGKKNPEKAAKIHTRY